jgi:hypothetical protein
VKRLRSLSGSAQPGKRLTPRAAAWRASYPLARLAISDPNDILSWEVTKTEFAFPRITVANIYLGTTGEIFGLSGAPIWGVAASPFTAHTNYLLDDDVMDIIACGMTGATINRCT